MDFVSRASIFCIQCCTIDRIPCIVRLGMIAIPEVLAGPTDYMGSVGIQPRAKGKSMKDAKNIYRMRAIITCGLYIFYPNFHCGLYCRAVYNAEWFIFHDSFFYSTFIRTPSKLHKIQNRIVFFPVLTTSGCYNNKSEKTGKNKLRFIMQSGLYYKKLF